MKSAILRRAAALICAVLMLTPAVAGAVYSNEVENRASRMPRVTVSGESYSGQIRFTDGVTYVGLREFSERLGAVVTWDASKLQARVKSTALDLTARIGDSFITANGKKLSSPGRVFIESGRTYVPIRIIGTAFGYETAGKNQSFSAVLTKKQASPSYSADDLYWLSRIIHAEARGESDWGKLAVGTVVLNRVKSSEFPNTIYGVIFDRAGGVQFTPVANGEIYKTPDAASIEAAKRCLSGERVSSSILFFINTAIAESFWITANRRYVMTIGNHDFYA